MNLYDTTMTHLRATFANRQHYPSTNHWAAIGDVVATLHAMADGAADDKVYLSSLDCGIGKSSTATAFARSLITSLDPRYLSRGMIVLVNRTREAQMMADELADLGKHVVVLTAETAPALTPDDIGRAQLLITTQQRVEQALERDKALWPAGRPFADLHQFHYHCQPRQVRVHDEAFLPGEAINLGRDMLGAMLTPARRLSVAFNHALDDFMDLLKHSPQGALIDIPDWTGIEGVTVYSLLQQIAEDNRPTKGYAGCEDGVRADLQMAVKSLFFLAGRSARVWRDNHTGAAVLEYRDTLPEDMRPLLVLDASGRVRQTYVDMQASGLLRPLRPAVKDYSPLTVHWWKRGGGKASFQTGGEELARGIALTIATKPTEDWLVVHHKPSRQLKDVERVVRQLLPATQTGLVHYCTWGNHLGTNAYADVGNVILAGTLFMSPGHYAALTHLCKARPVSQGLCDPDDVKLTAKGETADGVFQAISRGRVRKSDGDKCQSMDAYVIATPQSGMAEILPQAFPGATIADWAPIGVTQTKATQALDYVDAELGRTAWVPFSAIREAVGIPNKNNFRRDVLTKPHWSAGLAARGLVTVTPRGKPHGVCRAADAVLMAA